MRTFLRSRQKLSLSAYGAARINHAGRCLAARFTASEHGLLRTQLDAPYLRLLVRLLLLLLVLARLLRSHSFC